MYLQGERLDPIGAVNDEIANVDNLEDEKNFLETSLFKLTTRFAQIQFRLRQIINAPSEEQQVLIQQLEDLSFGDVNFGPKALIGDSFVNEVRQKHYEQKLLIDRLKSQLKELKRFDDNLTMRHWNQLFDSMRLKDSIEQKLKQRIIYLEQQISSRNGIDYSIWSSLEKTVSFVQMLVFVQFGKVDCFRSNIIQHWGDLRATMEVAVINLEKLLKGENDQTKIIYFVRNELAPSIKNLIEHGSRRCHNGLVNFFTQNQPLHAWEILLLYHQSATTYSPRKNLSRSFNLALGGVSAKTTKTSVNCAIEDILLSHGRYKRSHNSHFKAFICAGLNARKLGAWLGLVFLCAELVQRHYHSWSYAAGSGFRDAVTSLEVLARYKFSLPVDLDVRKFQVGDDLFA